jgi:endogenous inhibitor of DNA gyrase (YacG/DUF329 family)
MRCEHCNEVLPEGSRFCPKCGRPQTTEAAPIAGLPVGDRPAAAATEDASANVGYILRVQQAFNQWRRKSKSIGYTAGVISGILVFYLMSRVTENGTLGFLFAVVVGVMVDILLEAFILPYWFPVVPCPHCGKSVSIAERPRIFGRFERLQKCPHCGRELPH